MANTGLGKMHLDLYTQNSALTQKAKFWCNYVGALKGKAVIAPVVIVVVAAVVVLYDKVFLLMMLELE